jgi:very-short-patch-repair endonuclease
VDVVRHALGLAERQHGVITRKQALRLGLTRGLVDGLSTSGRWQVVHRGVYRIAGSARTWHQDVIAACLAAGRNAAASHRTAARLWSMPIEGSDIELTLPESRRTVVPGIRIHLATDLAASDVCRVDRVPTLSVLRTVVDLAAVLDADRLGMVLDHCLANRKMTLGRLRARLERMERRGRKGAGHLLALVRQRETSQGVPQSQLEFRLLRALRRHGVPLPECQFELRLGPRRRAYLDFAYPNQHLAIEADSYRYHSSLSDWSRDRVRNGELVALGWRILHVTHQDLVTGPDLVADQVARALAAGDLRRV